MTQTTQPIRRDSIPMGRCIDARLTSSEEPTQVVVTALGPNAKIIDRFGGGIRERTYTAGSFVYDGQTLILDPSGEVSPRTFYPHEGGAYSSRERQFNLAERNTARRSK